MYEIVTESPPSFIISTHARERYVERFYKRKKYGHLQECRGCPKCVSLLFDLRRDVGTFNRLSLDQEMCKKIEAAREVKVHTNSSTFLAMVYDKHGYHRFEYLVHDDSDMLFVVIQDPAKGKVCVTCFSASDSVVGNFVRRPKFKAKQKFDSLGQPILA
jgi:hypothetical protein